MKDTSGFPGLKQLANSVIEGSPPKEADRRGVPPSQAQSRLNQSQQSSELMFRESQIQHKAVDFSSYRMVNHVSSPVELKENNSVISYQVMETFRNVDLGNNNDYHKIKNEFY